MSTSVLLSLLAVACLALVHVVTPWLRFLEGTPRSAWLSLAGGVSVAYVFVHFLPELASGEAEIGRIAGDVAFAERHVYLIALAGLLVFMAWIDWPRRPAPTARARPCAAGAAPRRLMPALARGYSVSTWLPSPSTTAWSVTCCCTER